MRAVLFLANDPDADAIAEIHAEAFQPFPVVGDIISIGDTHHPNPPIRRRYRIVGRYFAFELYRGSYDMDTAELLVESLDEPSPR